MISDMDFQKAVELINKSSNILLTTHTRPDGDACGCMAAIFETLTALGKNVKILLLSELPAWYEFLFEQKPEIFSKKTPPFLLSQESRGADLIVIVDTDTYNQLPELDKYLKQCRAGLAPPILVIDHHLTSDNLGDVELIDTTAAATGLIVFDLLKYADWQVTERIARALFVAVATDTGWFQFDNTDSRALRVCAEMIDAGVSPTQVYHDMYQNFSHQRFKLMAAMLSTLELYPLNVWRVNLDGFFAVMHLTQTDFKRTGANFSDTENLIDECRRISSVQAAALFVELPDGQIKVSLRSSGTIDVCKIAAKYAGGGHKMAAGVHLPGPIENAKRLIFNAVAEQFEQST